MYSLISHPLMVISCIHVKPIEVCFLPWCGIPLSPTTPSKGPNLFFFPLSLELTGSWRPKSHNFRQSPNLFCLGILDLSIMDYTIFSLRLCELPIHLLRPVQGRWNGNDGRREEQRREKKERE